MKKLYDKFELVEDREIIRKYISDISTLHKKRYSEAHTTKKWSKNLLNKYFIFFNETSEKFVIALKDERLVGYSIYGDAIDKNINRFVLLNFIHIVVNYVLLPQEFIKKLTLKIKSLVSKETYISEKNWILLSICVEQGESAVAQELIKKFVTDGKKIGYSEVVLYVRKSNTSDTKFLPKK